MLPTDHDLIELEEQRTSACSAPLSSSPPPLPAVAPSPLAASEPHVDQQYPHPQQSIHGNTQQVALARVSSPLPNAASQEAHDSYLHPADRLWSLYLKEVDKEDEYLVESWKGDTEGILIFTGLFAATVATLVTQTYQLLIPSSDGTNTAILMQISQQIAGLSNNTHVAAYTPAPFVAPFYAVWVNTLWFLSLFLGLTGALMATLMQQWVRRYLRGIRYRSAPHIRGPMHAALRLGIEKYKMKQAVTLVTSILHASLFIFFAGLVGLAFQLNSTVASVLTTFMLVLVAIYVYLSVLPTFSTVAPYDTVLTPALQTFLRLLGPILFTPTYKREQRTQSREQALMDVAQHWGRFHIPHDTYFLDRILTHSDEHHEIESFLDSMVVLSKFLSSRDFYHPRRLMERYKALEDVFERHHLINKIRALILSCYESHNGPPSSNRIKRLRTVLAFLHYVYGWRAINPNVRTILYHSRSTEWAFEMLVHDPDSHISFPSRLITIRARMGTDGDGETHHHHHHHHKLRNMATASYNWYGEGSQPVAWPLFYFVELVCTVLRYATSGGAKDLLSAHYPLWEPILSNARRHAMGYMEKSLLENENLIIEPIPRALLIAAKLGHLVHPVYSPPARRPPIKKEELEIKRTFSTYGVLVSALRSVAETVLLIPLYGPSPRLTLERYQPAVSSGFSGMIPGTASVLFGPLTWRSRPPADAYRCLMHAWGERHFANSETLIEEACEVLRGYPKGQGYARICFRNRGTAQEFVDAWTVRPLPAYRVITAAMMDDISHGGSASVDVGQGVADTEEGEAQSRRENEIGDEIS